MAWAANLLLQFKQAVALCHILAVHSKSYIMQQIMKPTAYHKIIKSKRGTS